MKVNEHSACDIGYYIRGSCILNGQTAFTLWHTTVMALTLGTQVGLMPL